ncbi:hypothetical protein ACFLXQ_06120 [Chloroflexota bacterium]
MPKQTLSPTILTTAIQKGVAYLAQTQRPSGEFATYTAPRLDMADAEERPKSVYVTTFVIHSLSCLPPSPVIKKIQRRAGDFLAQEQEDNGAWHYDGRADERQIPLDLDDTNCVVAALLTLGHRPALSFYNLLWQNEVAPGGPYYTWLGPNTPASDSIFAREIDPLVNANILFCSSRLNLSLPGTINYLQEIIHKEAYQTQSGYCVSPHLPIYVLSRAYADGQVDALASAMPTMQDYILKKLPRPQAEPASFNLVCLAVSLLNLQSPLPLVEPYLAALLANQEADGHWPAWGTYVSYNYYYDGAPALTTALALEALSKYLKCASI